MKKIVTKCANLHYALGESIDYTMLFSEEIDEGWEIENISTVIDNSSFSNPIIVITALMSM